MPLPVPTHTWDVCAAMQAVLQTAFNAAQTTRVGASMTVVVGSPAFGAARTYPICRIFPAGEYIERLGVNTRGNDYNGARLDLYGWRLEYKPGVSQTPKIQVGDIEQQAWRDAWLVQNTLTGNENKALGGVVDELGPHSEVRYPMDPYGQDAGQLVAAIDGRVSCRKHMFTGDAGTNG